MRALLQRNIDLGNAARITYVRITVIKARYRVGGRRENPPDYNHKEKGLP